MLRRAVIGMALAAGLTAGNAAIAEDTGTLKVKFVYGGAPPVPSKIDVNKDVDFCGKTELMDEKLIVNSKNAGIKNVVVYVYTGRGGTKVDAPAAEAKTSVLANDKCRFEPHIVVLRPGDTLNVTNPDDVGHNANMNFINNTAVNFTIPPKGEKAVEITKAEPAPIPVDCNIHPWMRAYVVVMDHPYVGVSNEDGELEITGLPVGKELAFRVYHEGAAGAIDSVKIDGKKEKWSRNIFKMKIKEGENEMGTVEIPADAFSKK